MRLILKPLYDGITGHFPFRRSEWIMLLPAFGMWLVFQTQPDTFDTSASFSRLAGWSDEQGWGLILLAIGVVRLAALTINGTFHQFRFSPHLRMLASLTGLLFWSQWTLGFIDAFLHDGGAAPAIIAYGTFCVLELANVYTSASDIGGEVKRLTRRPKRESGL